MRKVRLVGSRGDAIRKVKGLVDYIGRPILDNLLRIAHRGARMSVVNKFLGEHPDIDDSVEDIDRQILTAMDEALEDVGTDKSVVLHDPKLPA